MQTRREKDAKTLAIARSLGIFVLVLSLAAVGVAVASLMGVHVFDAWVPVVAGVASLLSVRFLVRHRDE